jgi:hypothetical protein
VSKLPTTSVSLHLSQLSPSRAKPCAHNSSVPSRASPRPLWQHLNGILPSQCCTSQCAYLAPRHLSAAISSMGSVHACRLAVCECASKQVHDGPLTSNTSGKQSKPRVVNETVASNFVNARKQNVWNVWNPLIPCRRDVWFLTMFPGSQTGLCAVRSGCKLILRRVRHTLRIRALRMATK